MDKIQISLKKGKDYFVFRYSLGEELDILNAMGSLVNDKDNEFDTADFLILSYRIQLNIENQYGLSSLLDMLKKF